MTNIKAYNYSMARKCLILLTTFEIALSQPLLNTEYPEIFWYFGLVLTLSTRGQKHISLQFLLLLLLATQNPIIKSL